MLGQLVMFAPETTAPLRQRVQIELITAADARYILERFHYLHRARVGRQINYAVVIDGVVDGVITYAYAMMSATICDVPSDEFVEFARLFLYQNIPHTATCAIGKSLRRIRADWMREFSDSKPPRLVVSWSDREYHKGTIYRAANFQWAGLSNGGHSGRNKEGTKRGSRPDHGDYGHKKDCWVYWLR